ncbi:hypothetical protein NE237_017198 [Protea cynaroides]|uniref:Uncharacterized protein n=1 Tax=Protea cynaroides TaxID=273540 RepID=A0A9Q0K7K5_9MAGN|nr:hypothetical protein NE237_017198 [Protea cynaroides]
MVFAGLRVAPGMRNLENSIILGKRVPLSHVNASGVGGPANGDGWQIPLLVDLGKFIGFPSLETEGDGNGNKFGEQSNLPSVTRTVNDINQKARKRQKWLPREKGKNIVLNGPYNGGDTQGGVDATMQGNGTTGVDTGISTNTKASGGTLAAVLTGMPDLSSLPELVFEGGVIRVVIPHAVYERQLEKYKLALVGREDLGRWADVTDEDETLDIVEGVNTEGSLVAIDSGFIMIRWGF